MGSDRRDDLALGIGAGLLAGFDRVNEPLGCRGRLPNMRQLHTDRNSATVIAAIATSSPSSITSSSESPPRSASTKRSCQGSVAPGVSRRLQALTQLAQLTCPSTVEAVHAKRLLQGLPRPAACRTDSRHGPTMANHHVGLPAALDIVEHFRKPAGCISRTQLFHRKSDYQTPTTNGLRLIRANNVSSG